MGISHRQNFLTWGLASTRNTRMDARSVTCYRTGCPRRLRSHEVFCLASSTILLGVDTTGSSAIASGPLTTSFETWADYPFPGEDKAR